MEEENLYPTEEKIHNETELLATFVDNMTEEELISFIDYMEEENTIQIN